MIIFQSKKIEFKNANDFLSKAQFCFLAIVLRDPPGFHFIPFPLRRFYEQ